MLRFKRIMSPRLRGDGVTAGARSYYAREHGNGPRLAISYTTATSTPPGASQSV